MRIPSPWILSSLLLFAAAAPAQGEKVLSVDDYGGWNRVSAPALSDDGRWFAHVVQPNDGDGTLHIRSLEGDARHEIAVGSSPAFSRDGSWVGYSVSPGEDAKGKDKTPRRLELRALGTDQVVTFERAASFRFSDDSRWLAVKKDKPKDQDHDGVDLVVRDLRTGSEHNIGNVDDYGFNDAGDLLAYTVAAADQHGNGVYVLNLESGVVRPRHSGRHDYAQLTWHEDDDHLAVLAGTVPEDKTHRDNHLLVVTAVGTDDEAVVDYTLAADQDDVAGMVISEQGRLSFSADGRMVFCGIRAQADTFDKGEDRPNVDVWHWRDAPVQSIQERRAGRERNRTHRCAFHVTEEKLVRLATDSMPNVEVVGKGRWGLGRVTEPYAAEVTWGGSRADVFRVDLATGERREVTQALRRQMGTSPDGRWMVYLKGGVVWACDLDSCSLRNLTVETGVDFVNVDDDHPYEKPAWGVAGWSADGKSVVLNHRFDLWQCSLSGGKPRNLTGGVGDAEQIRFRYQRLDPDEETIDLRAPLLLTATGERTKKSGFYRVQPEQKPEPLLYVHKRAGRPLKAKDADVMALTMETFEEFPDWWVTNGDFDAPRKVTDANPQQSEYAWGRRVLVDYENGRGVKLQGTLTLPPDYQEGTRYPMLVYFYEKMSQRHHQYSMPRFDDRPQMSTYASDGYLVLMPDVVYIDGRPGDCAVDCVTSATKQVIELGYADPDRIALQGHSWGGYQSSFILTQTDMFCCVVTGAPVTNLISFYGELYKSSGSVQQGIIEVGQVRMGTTPFENLELFRSQSPWHHTAKIKTPFVILHGTEDGAVDYHQGLEFYNAARRLGKEVILLSYPGEGHHLGKRPNQIDFQIRMKQFFDHYCKGADAPDWMTQGVRFIHKDRASPRPEVEDPTGDGERSVR